MGGGGGGRGQYLNLARIMLVTSYVLSETTPFSIKVPLILLMSAFFGRKYVFFCKNGTSTQVNSVRVLLEIFLVLFSVFAR